MTAICQGWKRCQFTSFARRMFLLVLQQKRQQSLSKIIRVHQRERVLSFVFKVTGIQFQVAEQEEWWTTSQLVDWLTDTSFQANILSGTSKPLQTMNMSPLQVKWGSWRKMCFVEFQWETAMQRRADGVHCTWAMFLRSVESRLNFTERIICCSVRRVDRFFRELLSQV